MTGILKHRAIGTVAAAGAALLMFVAPASAAPNGVGVVDGGVNFTTGGVPLSGSDCTSAGNFVSTVLTGVVQGSGQRAVGTSSASAAFATTACESGASGAGNVSSVHVTPGVGSGSVDCWLSGTYKRTGVVVQVALAADATLGACTVNSVATSLSSSVVALFLPKHVNTSTDETDSAVFAGVFTTTG